MDGICIHKVLNCDVNSEDIKLSNTVRDVSERNGMC